jgi:hypothetical protein
VGRLRIWKEHITASFLDICLRRTLERLFFLYEMNADYRETEKMNPRKRVESDSEMQVSLMTV